MTVVLCATLSACAARIESNRPALVAAAAGPRCCAGDTIDGGAAGSNPGGWTAGRGADPVACRLAVAVAEYPLRRDAVGAAPIVGHVASGEELTVLDFIDRRFRFRGHVVFDFGNWRKVRTQPGDVGWLPAAEVREVGGLCDEDGVALSGEQSE